MAYIQQPKRRGSGYAQDSIHPLASEFKGIVESVLTEDRIDLFTELNRGLLDKGIKQTLKNFFVEESCWAEPMSPEELDDHMDNMNGSFENDCACINEYGNIGAHNPIIGIAFPMHKNILMNNVYENTVVPKAVAAMPKFNITMEQRIFIDKDGNEYDMFKEQHMMHTKMREVNPFLAQEVLAADFGKTQELIGTSGKAFSNWRKNFDHFSIDCTISAIKVNDGTNDYTIPCRYTFKSGYGDFDRAAIENCPVKAVDAAKKVDAVVNVMAALKKDALTVHAFVTNASGATAITVKSVTFSSKMDTSHAAVDTCSVTWREKESLVEIPTTEPINVTISPEEIKDVSRLYNEDQLAKIMSLIKDAMSNDKDDYIRGKLDDEWAIVPEEEKIKGPIDFTVKGQYAASPVQWRYDTFMDQLDTYVTELLEVLNDPQMVVTIVGRSDIIRKIQPTEYKFESPQSVGAVELEYSRGIITSNRRTYQFVSSQKLNKRGKTSDVAAIGLGRDDLTIILKPQHSQRIIFKVYDYQFFVGNDIRNNKNYQLPGVHVFDRYVFYAYQPVQARIRLLNPTGFGN